MGCWAHQDVEVDSLTVFLARGQQDSPVGELVSVLVQMCPWHIPPLIHGCIVPDAWKWGQGKTKLGFHPHPRPLTCLASGLASSFTGSWKPEASILGARTVVRRKRLKRRMWEVCERREGGQKRDTSLGRRRGTGMRPVLLSSAHRGPPQLPSALLQHPTSHCCSRPSGASPGGFTHAKDAPQTLA